MSDTDNLFPYREAVLSDAKGDISKPWVVNYYVWSEIKGELVRKRCAFNQPKAKERYEEANAFIKIINEELKAGAIIDKAETPATEISKKTSIEDAITFFLNNKEKTASFNTHKTYKKDLKVFQTWAESTNLYQMPFSIIGVKEVYSFSDYLDNVKDESSGRIGYSKKTFSNFISTLRTMWSFYISREIIKENPFLKVGKRKGTSGKHVPYTPAQVRTFKKICLDRIGDEQLWLFVNFIYYGFFRPAEEAQMLQIKHILKRTIIVPGEIAKNNLTEHVRIPKGLEDLITKYDLRNYPPNYYIFTKSGVPGLKPVGPKYMYMHNCKVLNHVESDLTDQDYDLYGWKHTGVIALYQATKDIKLIQAQCRHKDINTTDKYLRDLGLFLDENALDRFPVAGEEH